VTSIGESAFNGCGNLIEVTIGDSVTSIGNYAFKNCGNLVEVTIGDSVTGIGDETFCNCGSLTDVRIGESVTVIGRSSFERCTGLVSVEIPDSVTEIRDYAFLNCGNLQKVKLGKNVAGIGYRAFRYCGSLSDINIPGSLTGIGGEAFEGCGSLKTAGPAGSEANIRFEETVTEISNIYANSYMFSALEEVTIPESVTSIGESAFNGCGNLIEVTMGDSVTSIGNDAFRNCVSLETIRIPASVETIGSSAFASCTSLKEVSYLNAETIGDSAFYNCTSLETVGMVHNVKTVSNYAFRYCPEDSMTVRFYGTEEDWSEISIGSYNDPLLNANIIFEDVIKTLAITPDTYLLPLGETAKIVVTVTPEDADTSALKWSSSDEEVVTVDEEGNVTGITEGTSVITVEAELPYETLRAVCTVTVHRVYAEGITIAEGEDTVAVGGTIGLEVVFDPANTTNKNVTWTSSDESIAKVDENGTVTGVSAGDAVITVTSEDGGYTAEREVHVIVPAEGISVNEEESVSEIEYGHTGSIKIIFSPSDTTNQNVTWTSSDETVATVDENGVITAIGEGPVTITATSEDGGFTASREINILFTHIESIKFTESEISALVDEKVQLEAVISPEDASVKDVTYTTSNDNVAAVDENGMVTIISGGSAIITATTADGGKTATCKITAYPLGISIEELPDYTYTGQAFKPAVTVYDRRQQLQEKTDYTVTYKNNVKAGEASVIIKSNKKGNYKGTQTVHFTIEPADISEENPDITVDILTAQATGKTLSPVPTVYFNGKKLKNKTDYIVSYDNYGNRTTPGQHIVTITGKGNFAGTRDIPVEVAPVGMVSMSKLKVTSKAIPFTDLTGDFMADFAGRITLKNGKTTLLQGVEYEVIEDSAVNCDSIGTCTFAVEGKGTYVGSRTVSVKITGVSLSDKKVKVVSPAYVYTGEEIELGEGFAVTYNGALLVKDADYEIVSYSNNENAGTATAVLKGINKYTGTRNVNFKIAPDVSVVDAGRVSVPDTVYSKGGAKPPVTVEGMTLGTDYTVKYSNNTKAGVGTVTVTFKGNYKNAPDVIKTFAIEKKDLSKVSISAKDMEYSTKANKYKSKPVLTDTDGKVLKAGTDYETVYRYTTEDGKELPSVVPAETVVKVTVVGKGNYTGECSTTYRILNVKTDISKASFKIQPQEFTGSLIELDPEKDILSAKINKTTDLVYGTDYVIDSYTNNLKKGTAKVTFRGINGYGGTKTVSFKIGQRSIVDYWQGAIKYINSLFGRN
ncbi:MAG: leucine-rich repeat protein, partial [Erysipelotrichaceae bacterium]|nr:leucine-rich repeat protein [Erysipelotrichaceae bacterium]